MGIGQLPALLAAHLAVDAVASQVLVGIETDRGPWVQALITAGYQVYAISPLSARPLPRTPRHLEREERPGRCEGAGRPGPH